MHQIHTTRRVPARTAKAAAVLGLVLLICLGLAACGGSSSTTTTTTSANAASATGSSTGNGSATGSGSGTGSGPRAGTGRRAGTGQSGATGPAGAFAGRLAALRECLQKNGITLPKRTPGQRPPGGFLGGGSQLPGGVTRAKLREAFKKCGAFSGGPGGGLRRFNSPVYKQAVAKFAACMRENGVNLPEPNTTGTGPVFDTKGLNTGSAQFRAAESKCRVDLRLALRSGALGGASGASG